VSEKINIIKKNPADFKIEPNLKNYQETYRNFSWGKIDNEIEYFSDGKINAAYNAIDRHLKTDARQKLALLWENDHGESQKFTFEELAELSGKVANILKKLGVQSGDRVFLFLPRIPELYYCFLGILKTGAIAGTLFQAFGPAGIKDRLENSGARFLITHSSLIKRVEEIKNELPKLEKIIDVSGVYENFDFPKERELALPEFEIAHLEPEDRAFMLYTSGTTGKPKGVVHSHKAIIQEYLTAKWVLDIRSEDMYWCTADPGWVTGIAYEILGSWANAATALIYDGRFSPDKWYSLIDKHNVTIWYTAPTAIRMLMKAGQELPKKYDLSSLRHICSVGEPLNPEAVMWGLKVFHQAIHDNWWQTETGAILIANYAAMPVRPGSMGKPIPGIAVSILDDNTNELPPDAEGHLAIRPGWPSMFRTYWGNPQLYASRFKNGWYITGDRARRDKDGYFWFVGRTDDVINTAGHLVGPFEVESALIEHPAVAEAGVIGKPDPLAMEVVKAFVALREGYSPSEQLRQELLRFARSKLAAGIAPREIEFLPSLPKTRSGKIMRRLLKARELGLPLGDTSTLEED